MSLVNTWLGVSKVFFKALVLRRLHGLACLCLLGLFQWLPSAALAGNNQWSSIGLDGITISALVIDPSNPDTLYAGASGVYADSPGVVYKTTNGGASWGPAVTVLANGGITALVIDPKTPSTLYAGTYNGGVFKSINAGANWNPANTSLTNTVVSSLVIDPINPSTLYAGTQGGGVFKSTNGGGGWSTANTGLENTFGYVNSMAIDPSNPSTLYAGCEFGGVFKSVNGGESWSQTGSYGLSGGRGFAIAIDPSNTSTLYAGTWDGIVYKSANGGVNWTSTGLNTSVVRFAIDPSNPATVYAVPGYYGNGTGGVYKTTNGGQSWVSFNVGLTYPNGFLYSVDALIIDPTNPAILYAGTSNKGVYKLTSPASPLATTGTASAIAQTSATLNGTVNPNGFTTTAQFEYGLTTAYGTMASVTLSPNDGSTAQAVSAAIVGLQTGNTYHFRLTANNSQGPVVGSDAQFQTLKADQAIIFEPAPSMIVVGTGTVSATGGASGNPVVFSSTTTGICTVNGGTVTGVAIGSCIVAANQAGNANYNAATQVTQTLPVGKGNQTIAFGMAPTVVVGGTGIVSAAGGLSGNPVTFSSTTTGVCTVSGPSVTGVTAGTCTIAADQAGNANYNAADQATLAFTVNKANQ
ncbi:MAG: hypothetical protein NTX45_25630, partial [Proteobacteria bacterium]|nr:hypothetical protein [Pseudomonadota bacterium]